jgi:predicted DNA-binding transcriptional regulator YafY
VTRTDRLLAILLDLRARGRQRAEDLAARYETSVRTIYRDVESLCEAGIPIVALPGSGYELPRDYFTPALHFTLDEAAALAIAGDYGAQMFGAGLREASRSATLKLAAAVPAPVREGLASARERVRLVASETNEHVAERLAQLRAAVTESRHVRISYRGRDDAAPRERRIAPYLLAQVAGAWYCAGHDDERGAVRRFRVSRIGEVTLEATHFERPADFVAGPSDDEPRTAVCVRFDRSVGHLAREAAAWYEATFTDAEDGSLVATLNVRSERSLLPWLLRWADAVEVLEPLALRAQLATTAAAIAARNA